MTSPGYLAFDPTKTQVETVLDTVRINNMTKCQYFWVINLGSRVVTRFCLDSNLANENIIIIFIIFNILTKFCQDWVKNVASRLETKFWFEQTVYGTTIWYYIAIIKHLSIVLQILFKSPLVKSNFSSELIIPSYNTKFRLLLWVC